MQKNRKIDRIREARIRKIQKYAEKCPHFRVIDAAHGTGLKYSEVRYVLRTSPDIFVCRRKLWECAKK